MIVLQEISNITATGELEINPLEALHEALAAGKNDCEDEQQKDSLTEDIVAVENKNGTIQPETTAEVDDRDIISDQEDNLQQ